MIKYWRGDPCFSISKPLGDYLVVTRYDPKMGGSYPWALVLSDPAHSANLKMATVPPALHPKLKYQQDLNARLTEYYWTAHQPLYLFDIPSNFPNSYQSPEV